MSYSSTDDSHRRLRRADAAASPSILFSLKNVARLRRVSVRNAVSCSAMLSG